VWGVWSIVAFVFSGCAGGVWSSAALRHRVLALFEDVAVTAAYKRRAAYSDALCRVLRRFLPQSKAADLAACKALGIRGQSLLLRVVWACRARADANYDLLVRRHR